MKRRQEIQRRHQHDTGCAACTPAETTARAPGEGLKDLQGPNPKVERPACGSGTLKCALADWGLLLCLCARHEILGDAEGVRGRPWQRLQAAHRVRDPSYDMAVWEMIRMGQSAELQTPSLARDIYGTETQVLGLRNKYVNIWGTPARSASNSPCALLLSRQGLRSLARALWLRARRCGV